MTPEQMVAEFQSYLAHHDGYIPGTSGELWTQTKQDKKAASDPMVAKYGAQWIGHHVEDCSGAVVRACRKYGIRIYQGSNRIAREQFFNILPPSEARPGMVAFKARKPGEKYYDLPSEYRQGGSHYNGDLNDYYHIGCVDSNPAYVINAQSTQTGVQRSKLSNGWTAVGWLKFAQGADGNMQEQKMVVTTNKVNLRAAPSGSGARIEYLNKGDIVSLKPFENLPSGWSFVSHNGKQGYVMSRYLETMEDADEQADMVVQPDTDELKKWLQTAMEANEQERKALVMLQQLITGAVG